MRLYYPRQTACTEIGGASPAAGAHRCFASPFAVEMDIPHQFVTTTDLGPGQWLTCATVGSTILWIGERPQGTALWPPPQFAGAGESAG